METGEKGRKSESVDRRVLLQKLQALEQQNRALKSSLRAKHRTLQNIQGLGDEKRKNLTQLEKTQRSKKEKLQIEKKQLENENQRLQSEIEGKKVVREKLQNTVKPSAKDERKFEQLKTSIKDIEEEKQIISDDEKNIKQSIKMTQSILEEYKRERMPIKEEINTSKLQQLTQLNEQRKGELDGLVKEIKELCEMKENNEVIIEETMKEIQNARMVTFLEGFEGNIQKREKEKAKVESKNAAASREFAIWRLEAKIKLNERENEIDDLQQRIVAIEQARCVHLTKTKKPGCFRKVFRRLFRRSQSSSTGTKTII